jgi:very-short-patch-repair endonuclease
MYNRKYLKERRKELRNNATSAEAFLWKHLSKSQLRGRKFRRQNSINTFIVDFYCPSEQLIIEVDGEYHNNPETIEKDLKRDKHLEGLGFIVLRFENKLVFDNLKVVLHTISKQFDCTKSSPPFEGGE